jgi:hypothetical protein
MAKALGLLLLFAALTVLHTWPLAGNLSGLSRLDNDDTGLNVFIVSWVAHVVPRRPLDLFEAPMFHPEPHTLAYSEHLLVPSLMGAPLLWAGVSPITVYNVLVLLGFTLSGWSMALVVRRWTGSTFGGVVAGLLYAFNAHLLTRLVHLQALHLEFLPVALFSLDVLLRRSSTPSASSAANLRPSVSSAPSAALLHSSAPSAAPLRPSVSSAPSAAHLSSSASSASSAAPLRPSAALLASAFVLQALCSNYTLVFLSVALVVATLARANEWLWPMQLGRVKALVLAAVASAALLAPFLWPYYRVSLEQGLTRPLDEVALYSATWDDYLATGGRLHYQWWSHRWFEGRTALFPGVAALVLALAALAHADLRRDPRVRMMLAIGVTGLALSFGPALPGYAWLHEHVPLFEGLRGVARWGLLPLISIAVLAGFTAAAWERRWNRHTYWAAAALLILAVPTIEALRAPMSFAGVPQIPPLYARLAAEADVVVELPMYGGASVSENAAYLVHATRHFRPLVNGYSGFETAAFRERAERWRAFPAPHVLDDMRSIGVTHIVVHVADLPGPALAAADRSLDLQLTVDDGARRLYRLRGVPSR